MVEFYNRVAQKEVKEFTEIPPDVLEFLIKMDFDHLAQPFIVEALKCGRSPKQISVRYAVTRWVSRKNKSKFRI